MRYITRCFVCFSLLVLICVSAGARQAPPQDDIISTYAGGGPNNLPAINASLDYAQGIGTDSGGNLYIASTSDHRSCTRSTPPAI